MSNTVDTSVDQQKFKDTLACLTEETPLFNGKYLEDLYKMHCVIFDRNGEVIQDENKIKETLEKANDGDTTVYFSPGPGKPLAKFNGSFKGEYIEPENLAADVLGTTDADMEDIGRASVIEEQNRNAIPPKPSAGTRFLSGLLRVVTLGIFGGLDSVKKYDEAKETYEKSRVPKEIAALPKLLQERQKVVAKNLKIANELHRAYSADPNSYKEPAPEESQVKARPKSRQALDHLKDLQDLYNRLHECTKSSELADGLESIGLIQKEVLAAMGKKELISDEKAATLETLHEMNPQALKVFCTLVERQKENDDTPVTMDMVNKAVNVTKQKFKGAPNYEQYKAAEKNWEKRQEAAGVKRDTQQLKV